MLRQNGARESLAPSSPNLPKEVANRDSMSLLLLSRHAKRAQTGRERILHSPGLKDLAQHSHAVTFPGMGDTASAAYTAESFQLMAQPPGVLRITSATRRWLAALRTPLLRELKPATRVRCSEVSQRLAF